MQEGHGPHGRPEPEDDGGAPPGASWVPWAEPAPASSGQPGQPAQPAEQEAPADPPTTELGTWTVSAGGQGTWEPPPGGGYGGWGPPPAGGHGQPGGGYGSPGGGYGQPGGAYGPPAGGYGQPGGGYGPPGGPEPGRRRNHPLLYVLVAVVAAALGAGAVFALQAKSPPQSSSSFSPQDIPSPSGSPGSGNTNTSGIDEQAVAGKVEPGLVDITATLRYTGQVFEGTGMVLSSSGLVLTNNHVVDGSTGLTATVVTSGRKYQARIVGTDAADDVALLKLTGVSGLKTVQVGDSSKVTLHSQVVALGNAGGAGGPPTVTSGSITALNRTITDRKS